MSWRSKVRARAAATFAGVALVSALTVGSLAPSASAQVQQDGPVNCAAPSSTDCPPGTTDYTSATDVEQTGTTNFFKCVQEATFTGEGGAGTEITQTCEASQTGESNSFSASQTATLNTPDLSVLTDVDHDAVQTADVTQVITGGSGTNVVDIDQKVNGSASTNIDVPVVHDQDALQTAKVSQNSPAQNQTAEVDQSIGTEGGPALSSTVQAPNVQQFQNTADPNPSQADPSQDIDIVQQTTSGVSTANLDQFQKLLQSAPSGFGGTDTLLSANQTQGSGERPVRNGGSRITWGEESDNDADVVTDQDKVWTQIANPSTTLGGTKSQAQNDDLVIVGKLLSGMPQTFFGTQTTNLTNQGFRFCLQDLLAFARVNAHGEQSCIGNGVAQSQVEDGKRIDMTNCQSTEGPNPDCGSSSSSTDETLGSEGFSPGFLKNHPEAFTAADLSGGQPVDSVFEGVNVRFSSLGDKTLLQALDLPGGMSLRGAAQTLLRHAVTGYVCARHPMCDYPDPSFLIQFETNDALDGDQPGDENNGTREDMLALANKYAAWNSLGADLSS